MLTSQKNLEDFAYFVDFKGHGQVIFSGKIAWSIQLSQIITGTFFFYTNNYDWHVDHSSLLLIFYNLMSIGTCKAIMFHLNPIRGQHLTFEGAMGDLVWVSQTFGDRIIFSDIQMV